MVAVCAKAFVWDQTKCSGSERRKTKGSVEENTEDRIWEIVEEKSVESFFLIPVLLILFCTLLYNQQIILKVFTHAKHS